MPIFLSHLCCYCNSLLNSHKLYLAWIFRVSHVGVNFNHNIVFKAVSLSRESYFQLSYSWVLFEEGNRWGGIAEEPTNWLKIQHLASNDGASPKQASICRFTQTRILTSAVVLNQVMQTAKNGRTSALNFSNQITILSGNVAADATYFKTLKLQFAHFHEYCFVNFSYCNSYFTKWNALFRSKFNANAVKFRSYRRWWTVN